MTGAQLGQILDSSICRGYLIEDHTLSCRRHQKRWKDGRDTPFMVRRMGCIYCIVVNAADGGRNFSRPFFGDYLFEKTSSWRHRWLLSLSHLFCKYGAALSFFMLASLYHLSIMFTRGLRDSSIHGSMRTFSFLPGP